MNQEVVYTIYTRFQENALINQTIIIVWSSGSKIYNYVECVLTYHVSVGYCAIKLFESQSVIEYIGKS